MKSASETESGVKLVEQCADFAAKHGIDHMLDVIAGVHQAYARLSNDPSIKAAYKIAGIDLDGVVPLQ